MFQNIAKKQVISRIGSFFSSGYYNRNKNKIKEKRTSTS